MSARSPAPPQYLYPEVGRLVTEHRLARGWSQSELAERVDMSRGSIANLEVGRQRATLPTLWTLSRAFGIEVKELIPLRQGR